MKRKVAMTEKGIARGYRRSEQGLLEIVDIPVDNQYGEPYNLDGETIQLMGWPDKRAIQVAPFLLLGIE